MYHNKDIDRLFQEKFKDFEREPNPDLWSGIEAELNLKKGRVKKWNYLRLTSFAIAIVLFTVVGINYMDSSLSTKKSIQKLEVSTIVSKKQNHTNLKNTSIQLETNHKDLDKSIIVATIKSKIIKPIKPLEITTDKINKTPKPNNNKINFTNKVVQTKKERIISLNKDVNLKIGANSKLVDLIVPIKTTATFYKIALNSYLKNTIKYGINSLDLETVVLKNNFLNFILEEKSITNLNLDIAKSVKKNNQKLTTKNITKEQFINDTEIDQPKWLIGSTISPVYYASLSKGSPIDKGIANSEKSASISYSYGLKAAYRINKKWSFQTGIHNLDLSYRTKDINIVTVSNNNLPSNVVDRNDIVFIPVGNSTLPSNSTIVSVDGDVKQDLSYIEIPLELKYNLIQKKIGLHLTGGLSTLFLNKNMITLENLIDSYEIGKAANLNKVNYSANFGIDMDFKVSEGWFMNISPSFKYHLNTFSRDSGGFKPYSVGINTGLSYKF